MKTTARFLLSAATAFGLTAFMLFSAFTAGANASATVIAFALLAIYGMLEIAIISYAMPRHLVRPAMVRRTPTVVSVPAYVRVPAIVEMPRCTTHRRAA